MKLDRKMKTDNFETKTIIFPVFRLKSKEEKNEIPSSIDSETLEQFGRHYIGNGFFISNDGILATVAHVLKQGKEYSNYALIDDAFYKINTLCKKENEKTDENHIDVAVGKINTINCPFYETMSVVKNSNLKWKGYSRNLPRDKNKNQFVFTDKYNNDFYEIEAKCIDLKYEYYSLDPYNESIFMDNFFTISYLPLFGGMHGLSGSPVLDDENYVVGIFKGGTGSGKDSKGQVMYIEIITNVLLELKNEI